MPNSSTSNDRSSSTSTASSSSDRNSDTRNETSPLTTNSPYIEIEMGITPRSAATSDREFEAQSPLSPLSSPKLSHLQPPSKVTRAASTPNPSRQKLFSSSSSSSPPIYHQVDEFATYNHDYADDESNSVETKGSKAHDRDTNDTNMKQKDSLARRIVMSFYTLCAIAFVSVAFFGYLLVEKEPDVISSIAFGSCTSYHSERQHVWQSVIDFNPGAWIWLGDFAYLDDPISDCPAEVTNTTIEECACDNQDWLRTPPHSCEAGSVDHALKVWEGQLTNPDYSAFLSHMCPNYLHKSQAFPPSGGNLNVCPKPIIGIYDDHDFGWNDGNQREPDKHQFKTMFLDALGEPSDSPRRNTMRGIWSKHSFNEHKVNERVDVFLLDERYDRVPLPCYTRRKWCEEHVLVNKNHHKWGWCEDFLNGGYDGKGSCCKLDEEIYFGYCKVEANSDDPLFEEACNIRHSKFGSQPIRISSVTNKLTTDLHYQDMFGSSFCEVLGRPQRDWLEGELKSSSAQIKLVASGSVLLSQPTWAGENGPCSADDWDCYAVARNHLVNVLMGDKSKKGCTPIVMTGDYHFSDIKVIEGGEKTMYGEAYDIDERFTEKQKIVQIMASGLTKTTAQNHAACHTYLTDHADMRVGGSCAIIASTNFGTMEFDWSNDKLSLQIRHGEGVLANTVGAEVVLDMADRCNVESHTMVDLPTIG